MAPRWAVPHAKACFRRAVALAKLGKPAAAIGELLCAQRLLPEDREIVGMLRVLHWGEERRWHAEQPGFVSHVARNAAAEAERSVGASVEARAAFEVLRDPTVANDEADVSRWAVDEDDHPDQAYQPDSRIRPSPNEPTPAPTPAAARKLPESPKAHPLPSLPATPHPVDEPKFAWAKEWICARMVGLVCATESGDIIAVSGLHSLRGEALIKSNARGRRTAMYDLSFELDWQVVPCHSVSL